MSIKTEGAISVQLIESASHDLQNAITSKMHELVAERGDFTLAEIGYLFSSTLGYCPDDDQIHLRIYFEPRLACRVHKNNGKKSLIPVVELQTFENNFFVGNAIDCMGFTKLTLPKYKIEEDAIGRAAIKFKSDGSKLEEVTVMYIECNLALTIAAAFDLSLRDPKYSIGITMNEVNKKKKDMKIMINTNNYYEFPVDITVQSSNTTESYDPDDAIAYLTRQMERFVEGNNKRNTIQDKIHKEKNKVKSDQVKHSNKGFNKYS